jgi:hypothetical protein
VAGGTLGDCICEVGWPAVVVPVVTLGVGPGGDGILLNIFANSLIACMRSDPSCWKGIAGNGYSRTWVRSVANIMAASALDMPGNLQ